MSGATGGSHRNKGRHNTSSSNNNNSNNNSNNNNSSAPPSSSSNRPSRGSAPSSSTTRSCSPTTTVSNASSSKKSSNSFGYGMNKQQLQQSKQKQQQQQQQQQQQKQQSQQNPPLPPTVTVNSNSRLYGATTTNSHQQQPTDMLTPLTNNSSSTTSTTTATLPPPPPPPPHAKKMDILKVLAEVEGGSFQVTWRECFWIGVALAFLAMCSIAVGIAAGMTISIHYYGQEIRVLPKQKATMLDPAIALTNVVMMKSASSTTSSSSSSYPNNNSKQQQQQQQHPHNGHPSLQALDLGRVITTSKTGQRDMLSVVEELPPLQQDDFTPATTQQQQQQPSLPPIRSLLNFSQPTVLPKLCSDGETWGYDDWYVLRKAIQEANALSAERFMKWNEYMAHYPPHHHHQYHQQRQRRRKEQQQQQQKQQQQRKETQQHQQQQQNHPRNHQQQRQRPPDSGSSPLLSDHDDDEDDDDMSFWYYQEEVVFTICPNAVLKARKSSPPIFINAEHVRLECQENKCLIAKPGTHINFGRHAKDVWIRGITFAPSTKPSRSATFNSPASLTFYQDGALANFHDCVWLNYYHHHHYATNHINNNHRHDPNHPNNKNNPSPHSFSSWFAPKVPVYNNRPEPLWGTVADVNSSSTVNFYRCRIGMEDATSSHVPKISRSSYAL